MSWYDLLTRDHTVCRVCYNQGDTGRRMLEEGPITRNRLHDRRRWTIAIKAALRRHLAAEHPEWTARVRWSK